MIMVPKLEATLTLPLEIEKKEKWYISSCPILDIFSQGKSKEEAQDNLSEALSLFFISCFERGVLDKALKDSGLSPIKPLKSKKKSAETAGIPVDTTDFINVPIQFEVNKDNVACHA